MAKSGRSPVQHRSSSHMQSSALAASSHCASSTTSEAVPFSASFATARATASAERRRSRGPPAGRGCVGPASSTSTGQMRWSSTRAHSGRSRNARAFARSARASVAKGTGASPGRPSMTSALPRVAQKSRSKRVLPSPGPARTITPPPSARARRSRSHAAARPTSAGCDSAGCADAGCANAGCATAGALAPRGAGGPAGTPPRRMARSTSSIAGPGGMPSSRANSFRARSYGRHRGRRVTAREPQVHEMEVRVLGERFERRPALRPAERVVACACRRGTTTGLGGDLGTRAGHTRARRAQPQVHVAFEVVTGQELTERTGCAERHHLRREPSFELREIALGVLERDDVVALHDLVPRRSMKPAHRLREVVPRRALGHVGPEQAGQAAPRRRPFQHEVGHQRGQTLVEPGDLEGGLGALWPGPRGGREQRNPHANVHCIESVVPLVILRSSSRTRLWR